MKLDTNTLSGKLLLAMPCMSDPRFQKSVIFMCAHDKEGAMGFVVNQVIPDITFGDVYAQLDCSQAQPTQHQDQSILIGGPIENSRGFLLHTTDFASPDSLIVNDQYAVSGSLKALKSYAEGHAPKCLMFILGYAGWDADQLDQEIRDNSWLVVDACQELLFNPDITTMWERAMMSAGIDPIRLSGLSGQA